MVVVPAATDAATAEPQAEATNSQLRRIKKAKRVPSRKKEFSRLPETIIPDHYEVYIEPDYDTCDTYSGITTIHIKVLSVTRFLKLHAVGLDILEITYEADNSKEVKKSRDINFDAENEIVTVELESGINVGEGTISILYIGHIKDNMKGFSRYIYTTTLEEKRYLFGTHFEPTYARHAFPCLDEPNLKATFDVTLVVPNNRIGISNMPILNIRPLESNPTFYRIIKFVRSPVMSTYLLAFAIGEWEILERATNEGVKVRAFTPMGKKHQGEFALNVAIQCLSFYNQYFDVPYPLPKLDLVTFPSYCAGAMENWGMITFRETAFLVDPAHSSLISTQYIASVVAHEIAHQWFGNLVTMEWWTDLWLNEGFASFIMYLSVNHIFPQFKIMSQLPSDDLIPALEIDALSSSHPVQVEIRDPADISEVFDVISYSKGASILSMLYNYMGDELFRKGLGNYLAVFAYKNARTDDLWACLEEASSLPILRMMTVWTNQVGFPLIKIAESRQENNNRFITLVQEKFCAEPKFNGSKIEFQNSVWIIPVSFTKGSHPNGPFSQALFEGTESAIMDFKIEDVKPNEWLKVNASFSGFYRVHYPAAMLREFLPAVRDKSMAPLDRLNLLDDMYAVVKCGECSTVELLRLLSAFEDETDFTVFEGLNRVIGGLQQMIEYTDSASKFKEFAKSLLIPIKNKLGWNPLPNEGALISMVRATLLVRLILLDDQETINEGKELFLTHSKSEGSVLPDLRPAVYRAAITTGETEVFESLISLYRESDLLEEKVRILRALGSAKEVELMNQILTFGLTDEVKPQDLLSILLNLASWKEGRERAWDFFKINVGVFKEKFPVGQMFSRFLKHLLEGFCSEEMALEIEDFFKTNEFKATQRSVEQAVENIRINFEWRNRDTDGIRNFFITILSE